MACVERLTMTPVEGGKGTNQRHGFLINQREDFLPPTIEIEVVDFGHVRRKKQADLAMGQYLWAPAIASCPLLMDIDDIS